MLSALLALALLTPPAGASTCHGTPSSGRLEAGCALPPMGANYVAYSALGVLLMRTWVHCTVRDITTASYAELAEAHPDRIWVYGETGLPAGGRFWPHRTHQNGLSVDFMTPLRGADGPHPLPTGLTSGFGYGVELDRRGRLGGAAIDAAAIGDHLLALQRAARARGGRIAKVILDPELQRQVRDARPAVKTLPITRRTVWVRHDDHYHVDFALPCAP